MYTPLVFNDTYGDYWTTTTTLTSPFVNPYFVSTINTPIRTHVSSLGTAVNTTVVKALDVPVLSPIYSSTLGENYRKDKGTVYMPNRGRRAWALDKEFIDKQTGIRWAPSKHPEALNIPKIGEIELNDQEISLYHEVSGMYLIEELERVINSEDYQKLKTAWLKTGKKNDLIKDKLHLWLSKGQLEARNKAINWMLTNEENPNKDLLNARIEEIGDLMQKEADATNQLVN